MAVTHFKDGKTMLFGCAATTVGSQSCTNRPDICRTSGWRRAMTFAVGRLFVIGRQSAVYRTSAGRFLRTQHDGLPTIIGRFNSWPGGAPSRQSVDRCLVAVHDVRTGITRLPVDDSMIKKIGRASEIFNLARWYTDCPLETQMTGRQP